MAAKHWVTHITKRGGDWDFDIREHGSFQLKFGRCIAHVNKHLKDRDVVARTLTVAPQAVELLRKVTEDNTNPMLAAAAQEIIDFVDTEFDHPRGRDVVRFSVKRES